MLALVFWLIKNLRAEISQSFKFFTSWENWYSHPGIEPGSPDYKSGVPTTKLLRIVEQNFLKDALDPTTVKVNFLDWGFMESKSWRGKTQVPARRFFDWSKNQCYHRVLLWKYSFVFHHQPFWFLMSPLMQDKQTKTWINTRVSLISLLLTKWILVLKLIVQHINKTHK